MRIQVPLLLYAVTMNGAASWAESCRRCGLSSVEVKRRDGLARSGIYVSEDRNIEFPTAVDPGTIFPDLNHAALSNIPLSAGVEFVENNWPDGAHNPVIIHPHHTAGPVSGDCVMVPGWHTVLNNPRNYVNWLTAMKAAVPPDTLWYAPAAAFQKGSLTGNGWMQGYVIVKAAGQPT
jgi:hypothetical protein